MRTTLSPTQPVVHCVTERQARSVLAALAERFAAVGLATASR